MTKKVGLSLVGLILAGFGGTALAQPPELLPSPPRTLSPDPALGVRVAQPPPSDYAPSDYVIVQEDESPSGWYVALGVGLVKPHINSRVTSGVPLDPALPTPVRLPIAPLGWTGMPDIKIGYRFAGSQDELRVRYQGVFSEGTQRFANFDPWGAGIVHSRLDFNMIDVDYVSREFINWAMGPAPARYLDILFGLRTGNIGFESIGVGTQVLGQGMRNCFAGIGPHMGMDYTRSLFGSRLGAYLIMDTAGLLGSLKQQFFDVRILNNGGIAGGTLSRRDCIGVGTLAVEPGLRWLPFADTRFRIGIGYHWERWWYIGHTEVSNAELTIQGIMFRGEFSF